MQKCYESGAAAGGAAAAAAAADPAAGSTARDGHDSQHSLRGVGVSVLESLLAVTGDARVLLLAVLLAAAAAGLNSLNPSSLWYSYASSSSSSWDALAGPMQGCAAAAGWLLHQGLALLGLRQRGDSPSLAGAGLLLGVALLFLLADVALSVAVKWGLDWCSGAVAAFNRWVYERWACMMPLQLVPWLLLCTGAVPAVRGDTLALRCILLLLQVAYT
jgi:hypothetical protein